MLKMRYLKSSEEYQVLFSRISPNIVQLEGDFPAKTEGFVLSRGGKKDFWDYPGFTTVYREIEGGVQFSDDGSVYVAPIVPGPQPAPEPYIPTLTETKEAKIVEMGVMQQKIVEKGINVTFADGSMEHFGLAESEQKRLMALQTKVAAGDEKIPWHTSNLDEPCRYYSNTEMAQIINEAMEYATYHETYFRDLRRYINSLDNKEDVEAVEYGTVVPGEFCSEVLADMYARQEV